MKEAIHTDAAPAPIGAYSQAIKVGQTIYISGQIAKNPETDQMITDDFPAEVAQVLNNLEAIAKACHGTLNHIVRLSIYLTELSHFAVINEVMSQRFQQPFPARSTFQVAALPAGARIEIDAVMIV